MESASPPKRLRTCSPGGAVFVLCGLRNKSKTSQSCAAAAEATEKTNISGTTPMQRSNRASFAMSGPPSQLQSFFHGLVAWPERLHGTGARGLREARLILWRKQFI